MILDPKEVRIVDEASKNFPLEHIDLDELVKIPEVKTVLSELVTKEVRKTFQKLEGFSWG